MPYLSQSTTSWINFAIVAVLALFCIVTGVLVLTRQQPQIVYSVLYSDSCGTNQTCNLQFQVANNIADPVAIYYVIQKFIHNTKDYERGKVLQQLMGTTITYEQATRCESYITNAQMDVNLSWNGTLLNANDVASPCGLQAKNLFSDAFTLTGPTGSLSVRSSGLITRFKREPQSANKQWIDPTNEPFQLWMHNSIGIDLRKLYGIIDKGLTAGTYNLTISNTYSYHSKGNKRVELAVYRPDLQNCFELGILLLVGGGSILIAFGLKTCLKRPNRVSLTPE